MATRNHSRAGGNRPRTHPSAAPVSRLSIPKPPNAPAGKPRSVKRSFQSRRSAAGRPAAETKPRIPAALEIAIDDQRTSLGTAISLLYCLHSALRRETADAGSNEYDPVANASEWADLTEITAMLLVRLYLVHNALDCVTLKEVYVDPKRVELAEAARKLVGDSQP
jgi:hypothetical protein